MIASTPAPPYYAVIFTTIRTDLDEGYAQTAEKMVKLAETIPGYLGHESTRDGLGITISYWRDLEAIRKWKDHSEHLIAQKLGKEKWYKAYKTRIARVERDYDFGL